MAEFMTPENAGAIMFVTFVATLFAIMGVLSIIHMYLNRRKPDPIHTDLRTPESDKQRPGQLRIPLVSQGADDVPGMIVFGLKYPD